MKKNKILIIALIAVLIIALVLAIVLNKSQEDEFISVKSKSQLMKISKSSYSQSNILLNAIAFPFMFQTKYFNSYDKYEILEADIATDTITTKNNTAEAYTKEYSTTNVQVENVDEADIGNVKEGERVTFTVDAYPDDTFTGRVMQVRQEATTNNNVVTYEVVISAPNSDLKLKPGLTASVTIYTSEKTGVTCVPSKALRFTPTKETVGNRKIVDVNAKNKVWVLKEGSIVARKVSVGMTDGIKTQILDGVSPGESIISDIKVTGGEEQNAPEQETSPFAPGPPGKKKK